MNKLPDSTEVLRVLGAFERRGGLGTAEFFDLTLLETLVAFHYLEPAERGQYRMTPLAHAVVSPGTARRPEPPDPDQVAPAIARLQAQHARSGPRLSPTETTTLVELLTWHSPATPATANQRCLVRLDDGSDELTRYLGDLEGFAVEWVDGPAGYGRYARVVAWRPHAELPCQAASSPRVSRTA